jgi:glycosyltransferase involved in cell wall biosynthesis
MRSNSLKIFVSAYACEPNLGSEIGVGWHWVLEMSKQFDLWVLTRKSNQESIEGWLKENPTENKICFIYYDLPKKLRFWKKGLRGVRTYYIMWQKLTNRIVKRTMEENGIEIYHLLTYGNALLPTSSYGQKKFFIWGPVGVGDIIPKDFSKHYNAKSRLIEWARRLSVKTLPLNRGFKLRCSDANLIFCKTQSAINSIPLVYRNKAVFFTDVAVEKIDSAKYMVKTDNQKEFTLFLAVGRLDAWRGFDVLLEAFSLAVQKNANIRLEIVGMGTDKKRLEVIIKKKQLKSFVTLTGQVNRKEYCKKMATCDVVVNPALKEGAVTLAFDSMSFGKPLICVETGGYTRYFNDNYAVVIPLTYREKLISNLVEGILRLTNNKIRSKMGIKAQMDGMKFGWQQKGEQIYQKIIHCYNEFKEN